MKHALGLETEKKQKIMVVYNNNKSERSIAAPCCYWIVTLYLVLLSFHLSYTTTADWIKFSSKKARVFMHI